MSSRKQSGFTLLITLLLTSVLLGVSGSLLSVVLRQYLLSGISENSEMAFQAANAGIECILYHDHKNDLTTGISIFDVDGTSPFTPRVAVAGLSCMGDTSNDVSGSGDITSGEEQEFQFDWGTPSLCTEVSIYKFSSDVAATNMAGIGVARVCPADSVCTVIKSRGYNTSCANITTMPRTVERELVQVY